MRKETVLAETHEDGLRFAKLLFVQVARERDVTVTELSKRSRALCRSGERGQPEQRTGQTRSGERCSLEERASRDFL